MLALEQSLTTKDLLAAADREFENGDALAGTERLWAAMTDTLKAVAVKNGWSYDAHDLYPVVEKIAQMDEQVGEVLLSSYGAVEGYPDKVHFGYFVWADGDSHRMLRTVREFINTLSQDGKMPTKSLPQTTHDYLEAADREFENADALAATEHLWAAVAHALKTVAEAKGWEYDASHLFPVVEKLAGIDGKDDDVLQSTYLAVKSFPNKPRYGYFVWEDGDSHWMRRVTREFIATVQELAGRSQ